MLSLLIVVFSALSLASPKPAPPPPVQEAPPVVQTTNPSLISPPVVKAAELFSPPTRLIINSIALNVPVISVGADENGLQAVPADNGTVSWWKYGAKPGEVGSAVLAGHYKVEDGSPGVFNNLNQVKVGDEIIVTDEAGSEQKFKVIERKIYSVEDFPTKAIYENDDLERVNLVTCTGDFNKGRNDYSHRLVLYTKKVS